MTFASSQQLHPEPEQAACMGDPFRPVSCEASRSMLEAAPVLTAFPASIASSIKVVSIPMD
jgi:hypothetical protein